MNTKLVQTVKLLGPVLAALAILGGQSFTPTVHAAGQIFKMD